jgi:hypothetical protein
MVFSGVRQQNFSGVSLSSFAGATFASKTAPAKFKMRQQNFRRASKIINPTCQIKKMRLKYCCSKAAGNVLVSIYGPIG